MRNIIFIGQTDSTYLFGKSRGKDKGKRKARIRNFLATKSKEFGLSKRVKEFEKSGLSKKIEKFEKSVPIKRSFAGKIIHDTGRGASILGKTGASVGAVLGASVFAALSKGQVAPALAGAIIGAGYGGVSGVLAGGAGGATVGITRAGIIPSAKKIKSMLTKKRKRF